MKTQWRIVYNLQGRRGILYLSTLSKGGAKQLAETRFPGLKVVRISSLGYSDA